MKTHVKLEKKFTVGKLGLAEGAFYSKPFYIAKSHKLKSKLHVRNPSCRCTKTLKVLAEETALASPAPVHRGKTPYDVAKERGQQKVMSLLSLLYPVPQQAIFQVFTSVQNQHIERDQVKASWH